MTGPRRIQRQRTAGWRMPDRAFYVGRPSRFGNPFTVAGAREAGYLGTDAELLAMCVREHRVWLAGTDPVHQDWYWNGSGRRYDRITVRAHLHELAGLDLACWCPLTRPDGTRHPCHADVLLELANQAKR